MKIKVLYNREQGFSAISRRFLVFLSVEDIKIKEIKMKNQYQFLNKYSFNVNNYLTAEEDRVYHAFRREKNKGRLNKYYSGSVIYGANLGMGEDNTIYFHSLEMYYFQGYTFVLGYFGGIRDLVKGYLTPDEISLRNLGISEKDLIEKLKKKYA